MQNTVNELSVARLCRLNNFDNDSNFNANDRNVDNANNWLRGIVQDMLRHFIMTRDLWQELCSIQNLKLAFKRARKNKTTKDYVIEFKRNLKNNLSLLHSELIFHIYRPKPLVNFIIRDPKTRKISKSIFRDRVIHHALYSIIAPIFEKGFILDSYANQINKGSLKAIERFDYFKRKVTNNNISKAYVLKADIKKYFENINHKILFEIIQKKIKDSRVLWLIKIILQNPIGGRGRTEKSMPLGNLTSQFFANLYLNELDSFVKHKLKVKYYIRYVDDFVILDKSKESLENYKEKIESFLMNKLDIELHPDKTKIFPLQGGTDFLGFKIFPNHKIIQKKNKRRFKSKFKLYTIKYKKGVIEYDKIYDFLEGWLAYSKHADTYKFRKGILTEFENRFSKEISTKEINRYLKLYNSERSVK
ncbi:MAG: reverse transcriptase domain-containing protein [archaeon]